jgi:glucose/arabinose dehydrogenase
MTAMARWKKIVIVVAVIILVAVLAFWIVSKNSGVAKLKIEAVMGTKPVISDPAKPLIPVVNIAPVKGWQGNAAPIPATGLKVNAFATGLDHPRWLLALANGDVLVAEAQAPERPKENQGIKAKIMGFVMGQAGSGDKPSANRITLLRDADGDGVAETRSVLIAGLNSPVGMAVANGQLYIANADALVRVPFTVGQTKITDKPVKVTDLPGGPINHHWVKNVVASPDGAKLYVSVGSNSNIGENGLPAEEGRAAIWEVDAKTGEHRIFAAGLRNPNGMAWEPTTKELFTVVNERDELGSDIVPDYLTSVQFGGFYGWPWFYWGGYVDKRVQPENEQMQQYTIRPDYALGPHTASLGLTFAAGAKLGQFTDGAFIGQHGSWNRKPKSGYKVIFVPFVNGVPFGRPVDVLTGFLDKDEKAQGRPVGVQIDRTGALLVADDVGDRVWRVSATGKSALAAR